MAEPATQAVPQVDAPSQTPADIRKAHGRHTGQLPVVSGPAAAKPTAAKPVPTAPKPLAPGAFKPSGQAAVPTADATAATAGKGKSNVKSASSPAKPASVKPSDVAKPALKPIPAPHPDGKPTTAVPAAKTPGKPARSALSPARSTTKPAAPAKEAAKPKPAVTAKPGADPKPSEAAKALVTAKPGENRKPVVTAKPTAVPKPVATVKPAAVAPGAKTAKPSEPMVQARPDTTKAADPATGLTRPAGTSATTAPAAVAEPGSAGARQVKNDDLTTSEGRRQALRELVPGPGERDTFLRPEDEPTFRPERGFRGFLARMGFSIDPSAEELEERAWRRAIGTRSASPKTISVVNGKGGANKTPTAVLLAAAFGRNSGDPILVWDNNGTRGTLGWRTARAGHDAHSMDLLAAAPRLVKAMAGEQVINDFVHYQPEDRYSVLRTDPTLLASEQLVTAKDFDVLHDAVTRFFQLVVVDSGNDESAERWMRMIDHTDQLVIASTTVEEHAEAGALLLEALAKRGGHYADLARNAVVIISQHQPQGRTDQLDRIVHGFRRLARDVVTVPYDAALVKGQIRFEGLRPATRRSWLHAAAAVAGALNHQQ
ncbi:MinD-like ATPase involved in chromosome partitioning or flagellar assembly [Paeniglutamicibacter cryotolerans]|uniref:MinD-like ATPase involved in chromosome partitioning or flagellar assembly n=2 Tax=Paeniglutamicibacter cryotolerans TaxID=670079 RepID=A0A839QDR8_9MICC|nr:MinD-like ATPase involved in chromosome partitioning or flagellar assembly [Paeniglutamicibacter cryotolerans]